MKRILWLGLAALALPLTGFGFTNSCGNLGNPPPCGPNATCCDPGTVGYPVHPQMANVYRSVVDLETFGTAPVAFTRMYNSRTVNFNSPYWELGAEQTWQHNWNYEVRDLTSTTFGHKDVKLRYPNGKEDNFKAADTNGVQRVPSAKNGDRLYKWTGSTVGHTLVTPDGSEYDFKRTTSPKYRLEAMRNGQGFAWSFTYDSSNRLTRVSNAFGRYIDIERETDAQGVLRIKTVRSNDGREVTYGYGAWVDGTETNSVLTSVTYPDSAQAQYTYVGAQTNTAGRALLESSSDPRFTPAAGASAKWRYNYDAIFDFGNGPYLVTGTMLDERNSITDDVIVSMPLGSGEEPQVLQGDGTELGRKYAEGQITEVRDGEGRLTSYSYDSAGAGYLTNQTDAAGAATSFVRDYAGRSLHQINALGYTNSATYNTAGFVLTQTDALGRTTTYTRDASNRVTRVDYPDSSYEERGYNQYGQILTNRLRNGGSEMVAYYGTNDVDGLLGDLKTRTDPLGNVTTYTWNAAGLMTTMKDARNNLTSYAYNGRGQITSIQHPDASIVHHFYDSFGNPTNVVNELGLATQFTYDEYNRRETAKDALDRVTSYEYGRVPGVSCGCGSGGTITRITDPAGRVTEYSYDRSDRRTNETLAAGTSVASTTAWTYDSAGNKKTQTDANNITYTWAYDSLHRVVAETNALGQATTYAYDPVSNRTNRVDGAGIATFWTYDSMRQVTATGSGTLAYEYDHDTGGRRTAMRTKVNGATTETTTYTYDLRDRMLTKADPTGYTLNYGYDGVGNRTNLAVGSVLSVGYAYDTRNRVSAITSSGKTTTYNYDSAGRVVSTVWPNSSTATNAYDNANQVLSITHKQSGGSTIASFTYAYDSAGNRTSMVTTEGTNSYGYNALNWLTSATYPDASTQGFSYDPVGNRTNLTELAGGVTNVTTYTYGSANRLTSGGGWTYSYDGAGRLTNQVSGTQARSYSYTFQSQMTSLTDTNAAVFTYEFDGDQNRSRQTNGCFANKYVYDGRDCVLELNGTNQVVNAYVNGLGIDQKIERLTFLNGAQRTRHVYHTDALGSVAAMTDTAQATAKSYAYEAFGKIRSETGSYVVDRYAFTGREIAGDSLSLYYYRARVMDPNVGRFTCEDPIGFRGADYNLYRYVRNSPINARDPLGLVTTQWCYTWYNGCIADVSTSVGACFSSCSIGVGTAAGLVACLAALPFWGPVGYASCLASAMGADAITWGLSQFACVSAQHTAMQGCKNGLQQCLAQATN